MAARQLHTDTWHWPWPSRACDVGLPRRSGAIARETRSFDGRGGSAPRSNQSSNARDGAVEGTWIRPFVGRLRSPRTHYPAPGRARTANRRGGGRWSHAAAARARPGGVPCENPFRARSGEPPMKAIPSMARRRGLGPRRRPNVRLSAGGDQRWPRRGAAAQAGPGADRDAAVESRFMGPHRLASAR